MNTQSLSAPSDSDSDSEDMSPVDRMRDLAEQMVAHMAANQVPSFRVTGRVWVKEVSPSRTLVRVYTNKDSYAELTYRVGDDGEHKYSYTHVGKNRGSVDALAAAWESAE